MITENNNNYYSTFCFYDERGRRLSAFAALTEAGDLNITIFTYSRKDNKATKIKAIITMPLGGRKIIDKKIHTPFSKGIAHEMYNAYKEDTRAYFGGLKPQEYVVHIPEGRGAKNVFIEFMEENFYKVETIIMEQQVMICHGKGHIKHNVGKAKMFPDKQMDYILSALENYNDVGHNTERDSD